LPISSAEETGKLDIKQELQSLSLALESGITEQEYWWEYTPAQLLRRFDARRKIKEERMWEMGWFTRMILATQGSKIDNVYEILPFANPDEDTAIAVETSENDVLYMKRLMQSKR